MRLAVLAALTLSVAACGGEPAPSAPAPAAEAPPAELGETASKIDCPLAKATYTEPQKGYELRFRAAQPWELTGMTESVFDLAFPTGETAWGFIASNMGTSRDVGALFYGCARPGPDDVDLTEAQVAECRIWDNLVYSLNSGEPGYMPSEDSPAPERILLTDLGRKVRYAGPVDGPGDEPWDVFTFKSCAS